MKTHLELGIGFTLGQLEPISSKNIPFM